MITTDLIRDVFPHVISRNGDVDCSLRLSVLTASVCRDIGNEGFMQTNQKHLINSNKVCISYGISKIPHEMCENEIKKVLIKLACVRLTEADICLIYFSNIIINLFFLAKQELLLLFISSKFIK